MCKQGSVFVGALVTYIWWNRLSVDARISVCQIISEQSTRLLRDHCNCSQLVTFLLCVVLKKWTQHCRWWWWWCFV